MNGVTANGSAEAVSRSTRIKEHGNQMTPAGGSKMSRTGIRRVNGRRSTENGITLIQTDILKQAVIVTAAGSMTKAHGTRNMVTEPGKIMIRAGGLRITDGIRSASGCGSTENVTISMKKDTWSPDVTVTAAGSPREEHGILITVTEL